MIVFSVVAVDPGPGFAQAVASAFPQNHLQISSTVWLVAGTGTAQEISNAIGITPEFNPALGTGLVTTISGYYGRAPNNIWEWIQAKLEASNG